MVNPELSQRIVRYFELQGAIFKGQGEQKGTLIFQAGSSQANVLVIESSESDFRSSIISTLIEAATNIEMVHRTYIAIPRLLAPSMDGTILQAKGIGLLIYDDRRMEEVIPAKLFEPREPKSNPDQVRLLEEIDFLKEKLLSLEEKLRTLEMRIENVQVNKLSHSSRTTLVQQIVGSEPDAKVPSFLTHNPWLEVLSRRGREDEHIAA
jgi:hypothetical protein